MQARAGTGPFGADVTFLVGSISSRRSIGPPSRSLASPSGGIPVPQPAPQSPACSLLPACARTYAVLTGLPSHSGGRRSEVRATRSTTLALATRALPLPLTLPLTLTLTRHGPSWRRGRACRGGVPSRRRRSTSAPRHHRSRPGPSLPVQPVRPVRPVRHAACAACATCSLCGMCGMQPVRHAAWAAWAAWAAGSALPPRAACAPRPPPSRPAARPPSRSAAPLTTAGGGDPDHQLEESLTIEELRPTRLLLRPARSLASPADGAACILRGAHLTPSHTLTHPHTPSHTLTHAHTRLHTLAHAHTPTHPHTRLHTLTHPHTPSHTSHNPHTPLRRALSGVGTYSCSLEAQGCSLGGIGLPPGCTRTPLNQHTPQPARPSTSTPDPLRQQIATLYTSVHQHVVRMRSACAVRQAPHPLTPRTSPQASERACASPSASRSSGLSPSG